MTAIPSRPASSPRLAEPESISILAVVNTALRNRFLVAATALSLGFIVGVILLALPRNFTCASDFMLQVRQTLPSNLSGLASQFGVSLPTGEANQSPAFYAELLQSREVRAAVVDSPLTVTENGVETTRSLSDWYDTWGASPALRREKTIRKLGKDVSVSNSTRTGIVSLQVVTHHADLSRAISDRMLTWLNDFNLRKRQSQASAERQFTEARLAEAERELQDAEGRLLAFTERNRSAGSPLLKLEQDRLERVVSMRQQVYTSVAQAYDRAKIDEVRDTPVITVLQPPETPVRPDSRGIVVKVSLALLVGLGLGLWIAVMRESVTQAGRPAGTPQEQFTALWRDVRDDLRQPRRTARRILTFGRSV